MGKNTTGPAVATVADAPQSVHGYLSAPPPWGLFRAGQMDGKPMWTNDRGGKACWGLLREKLSCSLVRTTKCQM